jgi:hypothetical protein
VIALPVTSLLAGLFALFMVPLSLQVSMRRGKVKVKYGDAKDETLRRRIRAHGNFAEYVPMALIVLALLEYSGGTTALVWGLGAAFLASRVLHAAGMLYTSTSMLQVIGMVLQHVAFLVAGVRLVLGIL